ncbi:NAD(P)-binding protein [Aquibacillus sediminis]|uniref:NAD(P)-binding protein n=1 Tax=Aquibacillus sediminis TaxID=2574734 RepID=UPI001486D065|nr:NAD(P)-binding protein [Aquibacillus sediminis]
MTSIPLMIDMAGKTIVVIGGGNIAQRRVTSLLESGARITVISPQVTPTLQAFHDQTNIIWRKKHVTAEDLIDAFMIIVATNNHDINQFVRDHAPAYSLINATDDASKGDVQFTSVVRRGKLSLAISTSGASPTLTKKIKQQLEETYDESYEGYVDFLFHARQRIKNSNLSIQEKSRILKQLVDEDYFDPGKQKQWLEDFQ